MYNYADYVDSSSLPGEVYSAGLSSLDSDPFSKIRYIANRKFKFKPETDTNLFQNFLALQSNPDALFEATAKMPNTPFGKLS